MARKKVVKGLRELEAAEKKYPKSKFAISVRKFYERSGFISDRQIEALKNIKSNRAMNRQRDLYSRWHEDSMLFWCDASDLY